MGNPAVRYEKKGAIGYITINRPEIHNTVSPEVLCHSISAQESYRIGLVNMVVPASQLLTKTEEVAHRIAENGPVAVRKIKETVLRTSGISLEEGFHLEDECARAILQTEDAKEGPLAFLEHCKPYYIGR